MTLHWLTIFITLDMSFMIPMIPAGTKPQRKPMAPAPTVPQSTLYVRNLDEELLVEELKKELKALFAPFGSVLDVKVKRNIKHRGQAFISFESTDAATNAMHALQGHFLKEKPMVCTLNARMCSMQENLVLQSRKRKGSWRNTRNNESRSRNREQMNRLQKSKRDVMT